MTPLIERLLDDLEEELSGDGYVGLHSFSWWQRGYRIGLSEDEILANCREAYPIFCQQHAVRLMWMGWPKELDDVKDADPDTALDFHTHTEKELDSPFLALVPR